MLVDFPLCGFGVMSFGVDVSEDEGVRVYKVSCVQCIPGKLEAGCHIIFSYLFVAQCSRLFLLPWLVKSRMSLYLQLSFPFPL